MADRLVVEASVFFDEILTAPEWHPTWQSNLQGNVQGIAIHVLF